MASLLALLTGDYESMGLSYAMNSGRCWKCGRELTVPASIHRGLGPDCAQQYSEAPRFKFTMPDGWQRPVSDVGQAAPAPVAAPDPVKVVAGVRPPQIWIEGEYLFVRFNYGDPQFMARKEALKAMGARYNPEKKFWSIKIDALSTARIAKGLADASIPVDEELAGRFYSLGGQAEQFRKMAVAAHSDFEVHGIADGLELMPFQRAGVEQAVTSRRTLIADEMGLGKTVQALASVAHLDAFPVLVVPPASLKLNWRREAKRWIPGSDVTVLSGTSGYPLHMLTGKSIVICNYDILGEYKRTKGEDGHLAGGWSDKGWGRWLDDVKWGALVADESHYCKNPRAGRTSAVTRLYKNSDAGLKLLLSGTPVLNRPVELWPQLDMLGYGESFGGKSTFVNRYCNAQLTRFGFDTSGSAHETELNDRLKACGAWVRRLKSDVLTELPEKRYAAVPMSMGAHEKLYVEAEADCIRWFSELPSRRAKLEDQAGKEWDADTDLQERSGRSAYVALAVEVGFLRSMRAQQMVRFEALKHAAWEAKKASVIGWIDEFLEGSDKKLIVFAHHVDVVDSLAARYGGLKIKGGMNPLDVEAAKASFQDDPSKRVIICNLQAGGMGHTLTAASDVAIVEFPWTPALLDQAVDRAHRIGQNDSVTAWMLTAASSTEDHETIDDEVVRLLLEKRGVINNVVDGDEAAESDSLIAALSAKYSGGL
jgi:SNF2 family DNA or RNA helicase